MIDRRASLWLVLCSVSMAAACASAPQATAPPAAPHATLAPQPPPPQSRLDAAAHARVEALRSGLQRTVPACAARLRAITPEAAAAAALPFDRAALDADCGAAGAVYDATGRDALYVSRGATRLAEAAARLGDDLDYLRRALQGPGSERRNAIEHLHAALNTVDERLAEPAAVYETPYAYPTSGDASAYAPAAQTDATELDACARSLKNLVWDQGLDPESVRRRLLEVRGAAVLADLDARDATLLGSPSLQPEARADLQAAAARTRAAVETFEAAWRAFAAGEVTTSEGRDAWRAKTDAAFRAAGRTPP
jgi:hypothetical protein